jgi:hypothetical protein
VYFQWDNCDKDDVYSFKTDGTFTKEEGATKCNSNDPTIIGSGTWTLSSDENTFSVNNVEWKFVNTLTPSAMKISFDDTDFNGNKVEVTVDFVR